MTIQTHPKMLHEILEDIDDSENVVSALREAFKLPYVKNYMELAVSDKWTTIDPEKIEYKQFNYHISMAGAYLLNRQTWNIVSNVIMNPEAKDSTKTIQFRALSEMLYREESHALEAILCKDIEQMYPNITFENINVALNDAA